MEIPPGRGIRIFHEDKAAAGVADKERQHPFRQAGAFQHPPDQARNFDRPFSPRIQLKGLIPDNEGFHNSGGSRRSVLT